ncbi:unnamed protein product [Citrullus colocynthis]|uniref:Uncharacterized protein n=1 Tax=Citrullus colocynthis TaxID=252529 RepID=A0ABP0ZC23_9ROSI
MPSKFLKCIKGGCWLRTTLNGSSCYRPPSQSFDISSSWSSILRGGSVLVDIPQIDHRFYGNELKGYSQELKKVGVMFEYDEVLKFIGNHLMSVATLSSLTRENVISMLKFIRFLKNQFPVDDFIASIRKGTWLKTRHGYTSPVGSVLYTKEWSTASLLSNFPFIDEDYNGDEILLFREELKLLGVVVDFHKVSQLVVDNLKPPSQLTCLGAEAFLLILSFMVEHKSGDILVKTFKSVKCVKTNQGYKFPGECYLSDPSWGCILQVFTGFPLVDYDFYGSRITVFQRELKNMGVVVDFEEAVETFSQVFRQRAAANTLTKESAISFLSCYKQLKESAKKFPSDLKKCIHELKWLRTRLSDYRSPKDCILYGPSWKSISAITLLPFIDDSKNYYGDHIHEYKKELKSMGVITDFKDGAHMVAAGLYLPEDPTKITSKSVHSLLECIRTLLEKNPSLPVDFSVKVSRKWLKTSYGYRSPKESLLFVHEWDSYLKPTDGPFIDEQFYTFDIKLYERELKEIGPDSEAAASIWVPVGDSNGQWINPENCVLFDKEDLFGLQLTVLEDTINKIYSCSFPKPLNRAFSDAIVKVPAISGSGEVFLFDKRDIFIGDDIQLKDLFERMSPRLIFVWYPQPSLLSLSRTRLLEVYKNIGVRNISEFVQPGESAVVDGINLKQVNPTDISIGKELIRIILGFLADPAKKIEAVKRHEIVRCLLNLTVIEIGEPVMINYSLSLTSGEIISANATQLIRWERESSKLFTKKMVMSGGHKEMIEYATYFSEVISEGVLWEYSDYICALSELIKLAFVLNLDDGAVSFILKSKNLEILEEDEDFLSFAFSEQSK